MDATRDCSNGDIQNVLNRIKVSVNDYLNAVSEKITLPIET